MFDGRLLNGVSVLAAVVEKEDRLYGRGTCDMKSFIAVALALVPEFKARPLKTPVHFALSYDEEVGCIGVRGLIEGSNASGEALGMAG